MHVQQLIYVVVRVLLCIVCHNCELMTFDLIALYYRWPVQLSLNMEMAQWLHLETTLLLHLEMAPLTGIPVSMSSFLLPRSLE